MSIYAALAVVKNDFIVAIVHLYGNKNMKSLRLKSFAAIRSSAADTPSLHFGNSRSGAIKRILTRYLKRWYRRYQLRRSLQTMDVRSVEKDIGVVSGALFEEAYKPFWRE
jgi:uncharacterized protein YjiS (DUF1127 family)